MTDTGFVGTVTGKIVRDERTGAVVAQQVTTQQVQHHLTPNTATSTPSPTARGGAAAGPQVMKKLTVDGRRTRVTTAAVQPVPLPADVDRARMTAQVF